MNKDIRIRSGITFLRALLLTTLTAGTAAVSRLMFYFNNDKRFVEELFEENVKCAFYLVFFLLIFHSMALLLESRDKIAERAFHARNETGSPVSGVKYVLTSIEFYIDLVGITLFSVILSPTFLFGFTLKSFFPDLALTSSQNKLYTLLIMLPLLFALDFLARVEAAKKWRRARENEKRGLALKRKKGFSTLVSVVILEILYCTAALVLPLMFPPLITLHNFAGGFGILVFLALVLAAVLAGILFFYVRAAHKRRDFLRKLKKYCRENDVTLSAVKRPYRSLFALRPGVDFRIEKDGAVYDCKLIAGVFPHSPIVFTDKGNGIRQTTIRLFCVEVFHVMTKLDYAFASEGKKILIVSPVPKMIFASVDGNAPRPADTGEKVGDYTVYTSSGFLGTLDRDCL